MKLLTTGKAIAGGITAIVLMAIPIMVEKSPTQVLDGLKPWALAFYVLAGLAVVYAAVGFGFTLGRDSARSEPVRKPEWWEAGKQPAAAKNQPSLKELIYAANQSATIMLAEGTLQDASLAVQSAKLIRDHDAWHDDEARVARDDFIAILSFCQKLRWGNGPSWMAGGGPGDFQAKERAEYQPSIEQRRNRLVTRLKEMNEPIF